MVAPSVKAPQQLQSIGYLEGGRIERCPIDRAHRVEAPNLSCVVAIDILPKNEKSFVTERKERAAQRSENLQLVIRPFDGGDGITKGDYLLAIMEGAPTHKDVRDAACFQSAHIWPGDVRAEIAKAAEENCNVAWPDRYGLAPLLDHPATLLDQPVGERPGNVGI